MALYVGTQQVGGVYLGTQEVSKVYLGTQLVYLKTLVVSISIGGSYTIPDGYSNMSFSVNIAASNQSDVDPASAGGSIQKNGTTIPESNVGVSWEQGESTSSKSDGATGSIAVTSNDVITAKASGSNATVTAFAANLTLT